jgi:tRNA(fMet)-specific endonuclease VapC
MKYLLDTNTCIRYINGTSQSVFERLNAQDEGDVVVCALVKAELFYGARHIKTHQKTSAINRNF